MTLADGINDANRSQLYPELQPELDRFRDGLPAVLATQLPQVIASSAIADAGG